jgi:hypothetical protein
MCDAAVSSTASEEVVNNSNRIYWQRIRTFGTSRMRTISSSI